MVTKPDRVGRIIDEALAQAKAKTRAKRPGTAQKAINAIVACLEDGTLDLEGTDRMALEDARAALDKFTN